MRSLDLHALLGDRYPESSFHDSQIDGVSIDYSKREGRFGFRIPVGLEGRSLVYRRGVLEVSGLYAFSGETPRTLLGVESNSLWVTWDGALPDPRVTHAPDPPAGLPKTAFCHGFFISSTNSFMVVAAEEAKFVWEQ